MIVYVFITVSCLCLISAVVQYQPFNTIPGCEHIVIPDSDIVFTKANVSAVTCGILCLELATCNSIGYYKENRLCTGSTVTVQFGCLNYTTDPAIRHYEELCGNGGKKNATGQCDCVGGWIGPRCERIMKSCYEGVPYGVKYNVYLVNPSLAPQPFQVWCYGTGQFALMRRTVANPTLNFSRSWEDYKHGFGDVKYEHWLGLEKLYYMTQDLPYIFNTRVWIKNNTYYMSRQAGFKVGNDSTKYRMDFEYSTESYGNVPDILGDCLDELKGQPFSTYDRDNDNSSSVNCAQLHHGGYWFNSCSSCNPTGEITRPASGYLDNVPSEIFWKNDLGDLAPYKIHQYLFVWKSRLP